MIRRHARRGLTLLEVVVSMAIFLIALVAIWQIMSLGSDRAEDVKYQSEASLKCQSKMAEVVIGAQPLTTTGDQSFEEEEDQHLKWSMKAEPAGDIIGLFEVQVVVKADTPGGRTVTASLTKLVMDPTIRGSTQDRAEPPPPPTPTEDAKEVK